jgi:antitoxin (DNA-binding transcriptional repressor) of toxin-antitoxin stability system
MAFELPLPEHFRPLLTQVRDGLRVVLLDRGEPVAELVPAAGTGTRGAVGFDGDPVLTADFVAPLPTDEFGIWSED